MSMPVVTGTSPQKDMLSPNSPELVPLLPSIPYELWYILGKLELSAEVKHL